jgi:hypothetical protein
MGSCDFTRELVSSDIFKDIDDLCKSYLYGEDEGYSGKINTIEFTKCISKKFSSDSDKYEFISNTLDNLGKGEGLIINLGVHHYVKAYVDFKKSSIGDFKKRTNISKDDLAFYKSKFSEAKKYLLVDETGSFYSSYGSIADAKKYVNRRILSESFKLDYYILSKSSVVLCTGVGDICDKGISNGEKYITIPYNKYLLIGWARE